MVKHGGQRTKVVLSNTRRSESRAYIMHWAWKVSKGLVTADKVPSKIGGDINWDHDDKLISKKAAQEIVTAVNIAYQPSLTSNHIKGKGSTHNGNTDLHAIGKTV